MPKLELVNTRILPEWRSQLEAISQATGQTQSDLVREAIALYLKKTKAPTVRSRLDALEAKIEKLTALVVGQ